MQEIYLEESDQDLFAPDDNGFVKADGKKPRMDLLPPEALWEVAQVLTFGAEKYSDDNWRKCEDSNVYIAAALRHIVAHMSGEWEDPESGFSHISHALCSLMFVLGVDPRAKRCCIAKSL